MTRSPATFWPALRQNSSLGRLDLAQTIAELALSEDGGCANVHSVLAVICKRSRNGSGDWSSAVVAWS